jgi:uncharacterized protein (TIGR01777 family)
MGIMRIAVSGSSGLIGGALVRSLRAEGHQVRRLVRHDPSGPEQVRWDPDSGEVDTAGLAGCDAVVHLAGAGVGDHRWTESYKRTIRESRVRGTATLAEALAGMPDGDRPAALVCGSAIGYYGDTGTRAVDEDEPPGEGFLAGVCRDWEAAADPARKAGMRVCHARTGLVVARTGGAWGRLFPIFRAGLGGRMGSGRQYWSFISLHDEIAALRHLTERRDLSGPFNLTAPDPLTNAEVTAAMGSVLRRPTLLPVPGAVLRVVLGEFAEDVLSSQRVLPHRLLDSGFDFAHPVVDAAIRAALTGSG